MIQSSHTAACAATRGSSFSGSHNGFDFTASWEVIPGDPQMIDITVSAEHATDISTTTYVAFGLGRSTEDGFDGMGPADISVWYVLSICYSVYFILID